MARERREKLCARENTKEKKIKLKQHENLPSLGDGSFNGINVHELSHLCRKDRRIIAKFVARCLSV